MFQKNLLFLGVIAPILFIATDLLAGAFFGNYNFVNQSISELSAVGAPTRAFVVSLNFVYNVFLIIFSLSVWGSSVHSRSLSVLIGSLIGNALFAVLGSFFPINPGKNMSAPSNTMNVAIMGISFILLLLAILFGAIAYKNWFRLYSLGTLFAFLVLTVFGLSQSTPHVGAQERTISYGCLLWVAVLAVVNIRARDAFCEK
jgi:hypothetical protein